MISGVIGRIVALNIVDLIKQGKVTHHDLLKLVGLADLADKLPAMTSGGQQQSAAIARALANDPPILVADEPTGNLDSRTAESVFELFCQLVDQGKTIIMKAALVADFSSWLIETDDLDEIEVAQIDSSQPVTITADALPGEEFTGTVDRILDSYTDKNGDILYTAKIKLNSDEPKLRWGMTMDDYRITILKLIKLSKRSRQTIGIINVSGQYAVTGIGREGGTVEPAGFFA